MVKLVGSLGNLAKIESLDMHGDDLDGPMEEPLGNLCWLRIYQATRLPTWIKGAMLPRLSSLVIMVSYERREDIQVLGTLLCLRHLNVDWSVSQQALERCVVGPDAFPRVVRCVLRFHAEGGVVPCMFPRGSMPMLEKLNFYVSPERWWMDRRRPGPRPPPVTPECRC